MARLSRLLRPFLLGGAPAFGADTRGRALSAERSGADRGRSLRCRRRPRSRASAPRSGASQVGDAALRPPRRAQARGAGRPLPRRAYLAAVAADLGFLLSISLRISRARGSRAA